MANDKIDLVVKIGNNVCEDCGEYRDCGEEIDECSRIANALDKLDIYLKANK